MKNYKDKTGMLMIWRAIILTIIALLVLAIAYMVYPPRKKLDIYIDEDGCYYDVTCLEQKAFVRLMLVKMREKDVKQLKREGQ